MVESELLPFLKAVLEAIDWTKKNSTAEQLYGVAGALRMIRRNTCNHCNTWSSGHCGMEPVVLKNLYSRDQLPLVTIPVEPFWSANSFRNSFQKWKQLVVVPCTPLDIWISYRRLRIAPLSGGYSGAIDGPKVFHMLVYDIFNITSGPSQWLKEISVIFRALKA
ncbi:hypothetical protein DFH06DRAFT_1135372 [Mycena polygramma]|nr:hypothetical protein DFH06DRAFT_1135372 [Mycena polygramma]